MAYLLDIHIGYDRVSVKYIIARGTHFGERVINPRFVDHSKVAVDPVLDCILPPEAAQHAIDTFVRVNKWPRGSVERMKTRYRVRLSLGLYQTRYAAKKAIAKTMAA
jgi:hypothetical protein